MHENCSPKVHEQKVITDLPAYEYRPAFGLKIHNQETGHIIEKSMEMAVIHELT